MDGHNEKGKSHIDRVFRKVKPLRICLDFSLCLHFVTDIQKGVLEPSRRISSPGPGQLSVSSDSSVLCNSAPLKVLTEVISIVYSHKFSTLCKQFKISEAINTLLKHCILGILDYCDRLKEKYRFNSLL